MVLKYNFVKSHLCPLYADDLQPQDISIVFVCDTKGTIVPKLISGALMRVPAGVNHRIDWETLKDVGEFECGLYAELSFGNPQLSLVDGLAEQNKQKNVPHAIHQMSLYWGSRATEKTGQNSSSGRRGSHEGKPQGGQEGDSLNNGLMGFPDFSLLGRRLLSFDKPEDQSQLRGVVVLNISVNLQGQVLQAELNTKKSTISRPDIVERCKVSARKFRFSEADNHRAPPLQQGSITFRFELD